MVLGFNSDAITTHSLRKLNKIHFLDQKGNCDTAVVAFTLVFRRGEVCDWMEKTIVDRSSLI